VPGLSRIGRIVNPAENVSLSELTREACGLLTKSIAQHGVTIDIADDLPVICGDRIRLLEVMQNLPENAVKYMGEQPSPHIEVGVRHDGGRRVVFVRDNGVGIPAAYHERIFGLFQRLQTDSEGTGVGLALVERIVDLHGGEVWVESDGAGQGSTFCFVLPEGGYDEAAPGATASTPPAGD
jgi:signal transduction histidine kinase